jgi:murein DD-endopeptidase MepM/ murein hydrolase activator NlpD
MHTHSRNRKRRKRLDAHARFVAVLTLTLITVPLSGAVLLGSAGRSSVQEALQDVIQDASQTHKRSSGVRSRLRQGEKTAEESAAKMIAFGKERAAVRMEIAALKSIFTQTQSRYGIDLSDPAHAAATVGQEREAVSAFMRYLYVRGMIGNNQSVRDQLRHSLVFGSLQEERGKSRVILAARARLFAFFVNGTDASGRLAELELRHAALSDEYRKAVESFERATMIAKLSEQEIAVIRRTTAEVHAEVLRLQSELARIDARLQRKAERNLIDMGLMDARPGTHTEWILPASALGFQWPVIGRISAGFRVKHYQEYFGVPHLGVDIVVPMRTSVRSAAGGIVFLARDGGETGYSYVLIGHRGGFATLYGHLSGFAVQAGEEVMAGQTIGYSGGDPGSYGAGPMTTGAHLHFEVIQNGANVDPMDVLP